jgi:hypothetical protein
MMGSFLPSFNNQTLFAIARAISSKYSATFLEHFDHIAFWLKSSYIITRLLALFISLLLVEWNYCRFSTLTLVHSCT